MNLTLFSLAICLLLSTGTRALAANADESEFAAWVSVQGGTLTRDVSGHVTAVNLRAAWVTDGDLARLAALPNLSRLDLSLTHITDLGMEHLAPLTGITDLNLDYAEHITDNGLAPLKHWPKLERLNLRSTKITDTALEYIAGLTSLHALDVGFTQVTNNGVDRLSALTLLTALAIGGNTISDSGL